MNMRSLKRQVAKGRMAALGVGNVNRKMATARRDTDGKRQEEPLWKRVLNGEYATKALAAQLGAGVRSKRKIRKV